MSDKIILDLPGEVYSALKKHLTTYKSDTEQAAFVFATPIAIGDEMVFQFMEWQALTASDFLFCSEDYLELTDECRAHLIKRAHDLGSSLVEFHSHPYSRTAMFSRSDLAGFREFVPHIWWRLKGKPYAAVVVTPSSCDALAWIKGPVKPQKLDAINAGRKYIYPTGLTIKHMGASNAVT